MTAVLETAVRPRLHPVALVVTCAIPALVILSRGATGGALAAVAVLFLLQSALARDWSWLGRTWVRVALALWAYLMLESLVAVDTGAALARAVPWVRFVVFAAALEHWVLADPQARRCMLWATGIALGFVAVDSLAQYATGRSLTGFPRTDPTRLSGPFRELVVGTYIAKLSFPVIVPLLAWGTAVHAPGTIARGVRLPLALIGVLGLALTVLLSAERTPLLHMALGLFLCALAVRQARAWVLTGLAVLAMVAVAAVLSDAALYHRLVSLTRSILTEWDRSQYGIIYSTAADMWWHHPLFGVGAKNYRVACPDPAFDAYGPPDVRCQLHPHHIWLEWLVETGILGLIGFVVLVVIWARAAVRAWADPDRRHAVAGPAIALLLFLWPLNPSMSFFSSWNANLFWLLLGWLMAAASPAHAAPRRAAQDPR